MWLMMKMVLLLHEALVLSSLKHEVLVVVLVLSMWKVHVKLKLKAPSMGDEA
jgi:hypothetical protein